MIKREQLWNGPECLKSEKHNHQWTAEQGSHDKSEHINTSPTSMTSTKHFCSECPGKHLTGFIRVSDMVY